MEKDEKMFSEVEQSEACVPEQPTAAGKCAGSNSQEIKDADPLSLTKPLGISEEGLRTLRAEAQRTFEHGAVADIAFYKACRDGRSLCKSSPGTGEQSIEQWVSTGSG